MPEIKKFLVIETREVEVSANTIEDAVRLASSAFTYGQNSDNGINKDHAPEDVWGNTDTQIVITDLKAYDMQRATK